MLDGVVGAEDGQVLGAFQFAHIGVGDLAGVDGAGHQASLGGRRVGHYQELHLVDQRALGTHVAVRLVAFGRRVVLERGQQGVFAALPVLEHVGARADGLEPRSVSGDRIL
ncbi:hypothetical protein D3C72_1710120 [compost metagenome]